MDFLMGKENKKKLVFLSILYVKSYMQFIPSNLYDSMRKISPLESMGSTNTIWESEQEGEPQSIRLQSPLELLSTWNFTVDLKAEEP